MLYKNDLKTIIILKNNNKLAKIRQFKYDRPRHELRKNITAD